MGRFFSNLRVLCVLLAVELLSCAAMGPADRELCRPMRVPPRGPILGRLSSSAATMPTPTSDDDSLPAQLLSLQLLPADPATTPEVRLAAMLRFLRQVAETPSLSPADAQAVERFFDEFLDERDAAAARQFEALLRGFRHALSRHGQPALQLRAMVRLAAWLWEKSCPISGSDGACIERRDVWPACVAARGELLQETRRRNPTAYVDLLDPCTSGPQYGYRVVARKRELAAEAQSLLRSALLLARRARLTPQHPDDALAEALAHAEFLRLEPHFEEQLSQPHWPGSPGRLDPLQPVYSSPQQRRATEQIQARLKRWLRRRFVVPELIGQFSERKYRAVFGYPQTHWATAAHARVGQLLIDLGTQLLGCAGVHMMPPPPGYPDPAAWPSSFRDAYVNCLASPAEDLTEATIAHLGECELRRRGAGGERDPVTDFCREVLPHLKPSEWPVMHELVPPPPAPALPFDVAPPYSVCSPG